ncbi:hypothetical protein P168DRAFT_14059 [Aspergillus campestris IBT 28561]|uniref:Uncharacterized protein n=1 Tax=Aspergillus campestris (strain IBT 28561) TaxID=1392248 RepID=A0A2I1DEQ0_ASPC2|nr:uncharacterized protein P168DRAFT_14059 [Aspergillus campestris IBT 28561]PKY08331.1 hypothetical protein P168DRAFT_14059 [Aspergillus campestris IBT 28561]
MKTTGWSSLDKPGTCGSCPDRRLSKPDRCLRHAPRAVLWNVGTYRQINRSSRICQETVVCAGYIWRSRSTNIENG